MTMGNATRTTESPKAGANGNGGTPELTAAEKLAAARAAAEQARAEAAKVEAELAKLEADEAARKLAESLTGVKADAEAIVAFATAGNADGIADALTKARAVVTALAEVAKANKVKGSGRGDGSQSAPAGGDKCQPWTWRVLALGFMSDPQKAWTDAMISNEIHRLTGNYKPSTGAVKNNAKKAVANGWATESDVDGTFAVIPTSGILSQATDVPGVVTIHGEKSE
jgi:hypothetical protein